MLERKVCMLGAPGVGKRSLTSRFEPPFSADYRTSISVRVCKRMFEVDGRSFKMVVWDITYDDRFLRLQINYLRAMSGYLLVADGTRSKTVGLRGTLSSGFGHLRPSGKFRFCCC